MFNWVLNSKYVSDKDSKYDMNFKITQICISIVTFYCQKRRERINFVQLASLFYFFRECWRVKIFNLSATKKVSKKNFFSDIARINAVVNFYSNDYMMHMVQLNTLKMPVHKYQNTQKALRLRKNTFLCVHLFPYYERVIFCWTEHHSSLAEYDFNHGSSHI